MLRLIGAVLLLAGTGGFSACCCIDMQRRLECLCEMKRMYELLYSQVDYAMATFPEACRMVSKDVKEPFSAMLCTMYEKAELNIGKPFPQIWTEQAEEYFIQLPLKKTDRRMLTEFSRSLGYADRELQKQSVVNEVSVLAAEIQKTQMHMAERKKLTMSFGIMGGLLLVIVLL